jgi:hypothetical protein
MISIMAGLEIVVLELYQISMALAAQRYSALHWSAPISISPTSILKYQENSHKALIKR